MEKLQQTRKANLPERGAFAFGWQAPLYEEVEEIHNRRGVNFEGCQMIHVGKAIKLAIERGRQHEAMSSGKLRVRFRTEWGDGFDGLTIHARITASEGHELKAQQGTAVVSC